MAARDTFTATVDGAAAHAAGFDTGYEDDRPTLADVSDDRWAPSRVAAHVGSCPGCGVFNDGHVWHHGTCPVGPAHLLWKGEAV